MSNERAAIPRSNEKDYAPATLDLATNAVDAQVTVEHGGRRGTLSFHGVLFTSDKGSGGRGDDHVTAERSSAASLQSIASGREAVSYTVIG
jgi:hypothetical protein